MVVDKKKRVFKFESFRRIEKEEGTKVCKQVRGRFLVDTLQFSVFLGKHNSLNPLGMLTLADVPWKHVIKLVSGTERGDQDLKQSSRL